MAKKFSKVTGLNKIFNYSSSKIDDTTTIYIYDTSVLKSGTTYDINEYSILFISADTTDIGRYVGTSVITSSSKYIWTRGDIYSFIGGSQQSLYWRKILIQDVEKLGQTNDKDINFKSESNILSITTNEVGQSTQLDVKFNIDETKIKEDLGLAAVAFDGKYSSLVEKLVAGDGITITGNTISADLSGVSFGNGALNFTIPTTEVFSDAAPDKKVNLTPTTIKVTDPGFTANTSTDHTTEISYTGKADRVDWYVDQETRLEPSSTETETTSKKFVYIEPLEEYFQPASFPGVSSITKKDIISQDSIVFITCGDNDSTTFGNPEYEKGSRWIWTQGRMFSANTWMPVYTRETSTSSLNKINPSIGNNLNGAKMIIQGSGGITVQNSINDTERIITIDASGIGGGAEGGKSITASQPIELETTTSTINIKLNLWGEIPTIS